MTSWFQGSAPKGPGFQGDAPPEARNTVQALKEVAEEIQRLRSPTGKREAPGITCKDIALADPSLKNGYYWINPNGGSISDAIRVFCKMKAEKTQTCLESATHEYDHKKWEFTQQEQGVWSFAASFIEKEVFDYGSHKSQIKMLQHHTDNARQRIVMKCMNTVAIYDKAANGYDRAITLTSFDEELMTARSKRPFRYRVLKDECQEMDGSAGQAVLEIGGAKQMKRLPILDVGFAQQSEGQFGLKIGRACFWEKGGRRRK